LELRFCFNKKSDIISDGKTNAKEEAMGEMVTLVLAAGHGKRMKSNKHKVLHSVCGIPMLKHVTDLAKKLNSTTTVCVIGHEKEQLIPLIEAENISWVEQAEQLGTGHAVKMGAAYFADRAVDVLVLYGDTPLMSEDTMQAFLTYHRQNDYQASLISTHMSDPSGYGRILRNQTGDFYRIVEHKEATEEERRITEINSGICLFKSTTLAVYLDKLKNNNVQGEYYLTDVFEALAADGHAIGAYVCRDPEQLMGVNDRKQLAQAEMTLQKRIIEKHQENGVTIINPNATMIERDVKIGVDTIVYPGSMLKGQTVIGEECVIGPNADITDTQLGNQVSVKHSTLIESTVDDFTKVGPYAYLRPHSHIGKDVKIGDFVEVKNSRIEDGAKISHLTYVGDGVVGKRSNIGCGVVFVNYDGKNKHLTEVGEDAFVGCNVNLIAPVKVGNRAYVAAGSTINQDVPDDQMAIARERQTNKAGWSSKYQK
jgi:bifunctional UDP-N-acetylglucosamine pyrophosphorylase/glucosamine-1-phosphate N-acetyltransferase